MKKKKNDINNYDLFVGYILYMVKQINYIVKQKVLLNISS